MNKERAGPSDALKDAIDVQHLSLPDIGRCNNTALRKAMRRVSQLYDEVLAPSGLRATQRAMLVQIARADSATMTELADALVLDRSALAHNLKPLERDGLVVIAADALDGRIRRVRLSSIGRERLDASAALWMNAQRRFEHVFGVEEAAVLRDSLRIVSSDEFERAFQGAPHL